MFCGPRPLMFPEAEPRETLGSREHKTYCFLKVTVNKCFVIYQLSKNQKQTFATVNIFIRNSLKIFQQTNLFLHKVFQKIVEAVLMAFVVDYQSFPQNEFCKFILIIIQNDLICKSVLPKSRLRRPMNFRFCYSRSTTYCCPLPRETSTFVHVHVIPSRPIRAREKWTLTVGIQ